ncbi:RNA polymerase sigma factor [Runella sp.]|uniref:RNA polymerase sigma factor n=1 Tax=Runella sp. TaxID=1960881 RepID=UPI003D0B5D53
MPIPHDEPLLAQLWSRFKAGDEKAFDQLAELRYRVLFNYATRFTKNRDFIKDCIQDLFLELWERREKLVDTPYVTIYLIKSLRNNLFRQLRQEKSLGETDDWDKDSFTDEMTAERELIAAELLSEQAQTLRRAIEQLPSRQQEVIFLKFYEGLSNEEIAQIMDVERQTVANFLYRALTQMKHLLPAFIILLPLFLLMALFFA